jgi:hypothetical protein
MNKTFNFKRFGKYFRYDLVSAWQNAGVSILTIAAMPVWFYVIAQLISVVFKGHFADFSTGGILAAYMVSFILVFLFFPVQHYGRITDKKAGSDWVLIPASRFEKFFSMLLVTCVALPVAWLGVIASCDGLMTLLLSNYDGMGLVAVMDGLKGAMTEIHTDNVSLAFNAPSLLYLEWCGNILLFTLGAIFFRRNKIVYTFLSIFAIGLAATLAIGLVFGGNIEIQPQDISEDRIMRLFNMGLYLFYIVSFALLDLGLYFRIKTLKH